MVDVKPTDGIQMSDQKQMLSDPYAMQQQQQDTAQAFHPNAQPQPVNYMMQQQQPMQQQQMQMQQMTPEQQAQYNQMAQQQQQVMMQQQQQQYHQNAADAAQMDNPYPTSINPEVAKEVEKHKKKEKKQNERNPLNVVGVLRDDPDRQRFVIKTYAIVMCQLLFTCGAVAFVLLHEPAKEWIRENYWLHYVALVIGIALMCSLLCCMKNARVVPRNYILLALFTIVWTYMVAGFTQWFEPEDVLTAAGMTASMFVGLTAFACFCKMKLTWLWGIAAAGTLAVFPLFIFSWIYPSKWLFNVICFVVIILTSIYIIFDTKLIMTKLELDEYIIGALMLYIDIVQLFMWLLSLMGSN